MRKANVMVNTLTKHWPILAKLDEVLNIEDNKIYIQVCIKVFSLIEEKGKNFSNSKRKLGRHFC